MQHLFLPPENFMGETALIVGADHLHLTRVLRARAGEQVVLLDNRGNAYGATLVTIGKSETVARIEEPLTFATEPKLSLVVAQALGKGDKFEQVVQHGTEVGATAFIPLKAERCVVDIPAAKVTERVGRWQQVAKSAAEQSHRLFVPKVNAPMSFPKLLQHLEETETQGLILHPGEDSIPLHSVLESLEIFPSRLLIAIGPEGGWSSSEVLGAKAGNLKCVSLGARVLRMETAALVALSQILYANGDRTSPSPSRRGN